MTDQEIIEGATKLKDGESLMVALGGGYYAEIWRKYDSLHLFDCGQSGTPSHIEACHIHCAHILIDKMNSWT